MVFLLNDIYSIFRIPDINLSSDDPLSQGHTDQSSINKPAESMLSLVEESANEPAEENMMVVRVETQSEIEALSIVLIQVCLPLSQTTTEPEIEPTPMPEIEPTPAKSPSEKINEETAKSTPKSPPETEESTPTLPPAPSKVNPAPEDAAALMMMAPTASYIPKEGPMPSFSLGLTDSSQEEATTQEGAATQEGQRAKTPKMPKLIEQLGELVEKIAGSGVKTEGKTPPIHKQSGEESFKKFVTPARTNEMSAEIKEKCYIWATRVKTYADGNTNEYDTVCTLNAQDKYILSKIHFASLQVDTHIEAEIVSAMCFILNQQKIKRFQEEIYCLSPDIVNMAIANHPERVFLKPKNNKSFRVEDYPMVIPFLDLKKLASHRYIFAPVCHSQHWWLWVADTRKKKTFVLDPYHKTCPADERKTINIFVVSRFCVLYFNIWVYDCAIYVMKWLEIIQPENVKREKYEWDN
ncbi:hypothetical protein Ahy_B06g084092 [Arachis hypogaea]|uniref:Ubiquitin-like protease family profile domain-containing protein n=2 Tax=Arachis TaxID=3817 RepID=A0A444YR42_ARAHY|nr:hypothetical protein Ahy_B06g084092 [Arachis hypogaea]